MTGQDQGGAVPADVAGLNVLFVDDYTVRDPRAAAGPGGAPVSSDAIGYGISASDSLVRGLRDLGVTVTRPLLDQTGASAEDPRPDRVSWLLNGYRTVVQSLQPPPDVVLLFHAFALFPTEIRRFMHDLGISVPLVGYTHGSHWDPTDTYRFEHYPDLALLDLANLLVLDRVLLVSTYLRATLRSTVAQLNQDLAADLDRRGAVVGLPLDTVTLDRCRVTADSSARPVIVFNHAPVPSKNVAVFVRVARRVLEQREVVIAFTRDHGSAPGGETVAELAADFPDRVVLGRDLPLEEYFQLLWRADIQVSTASHESLGVSTLEAMYAQTCCLLPRLGSYPEITGNHPEALYPPGDEAALEERILSVIDDPGKRQRIAAALKAQTARYAPATVARSVADVLHTVVRENAARRPDGAGHLG